MLYLIVDLHNGITRAIAASLAMYGQSDCEVEQQLSAFSSTTTMAQSAISDEEVALAEALALSAQQMEQEQRRRMEDDELLERIIQLSLVEQWFSVDLFPIIVLSIFF